MIRYTPKQNFIGSDKILYVFKNAQGMTYNGEINVEVLAQGAGNTEPTVNNAESSSPDTSSGGGSTHWLLWVLLCIAAIRKSRLRRSM